MLPDVFEALLVLVDPSFRRRLGHQCDDGHQQDLCDQYQNERMESGDVRWQGTEFERPDTDETVYDASVDAGFG